MLLVLLTRLKVLPCVRGSVMTNKRFWMGRLNLNTFVYNLFYSQSIIELSLIYPFYTSLGSAIHFMPTDISRELSLQITMKSSCNFLFNHLGMPTIHNSTQFSHVNSLIQFSPDYSYNCQLRSSLLLHQLCMDPTENTVGINEEACLPRRCLAVDFIFFACLCVVGMCLKIRYLVTGK
jgi:hypothetical protein